MDNSTYFMLSKQVAAFNKINVTADNVANSNTTGFKKEHMVFDKYLTQDTREKVAFPNDVATTLDLKDGGLVPTQRPLDVALVGSGFFVVNTKGGIQYTRNGNFFINAENTLVNDKGSPILTADNQEIGFEEGDPPPVILQDGTITVNGEARGVIGVVEFANPRLIRKTGEGLFTSEAAPEAKEDARIIQGMLEGSNVNAIEEMVKLAEVQKDATVTSNLINDLYNMQRSTYKVYSKIGE
ncbi:flagellar basal body rod protein [endosymbiont of Acanthamoeba sp. UWC8]|uniref:flagellar hook-basal body complex protein n=1 Tax=endosymbiont of Acanthamoeba sp. UWC8 TaxID=86106 RepID=UPI0004D182E6|nr:flagellar hook-basal body complex protein [endosymbiont of Acanthamoeba sp. UWC8]AIF81531.1 flagellar basal body rod protein [endosymbiont of Acanthamoeba sp. UWC8]